MTESPAVAPLLPAIGLFNVQFKFLSTKDEMTR